MQFLVQWLIEWPRRVAGHILWLAPLFARVVVGWVFLWSGLGKLQNLQLVTDNFVGWGIPFPQILTPFVSGVEFFGGLFLLLVLRLEGRPVWDRCRNYIAIAFPVYLFFGVLDRLYQFYRFGSWTNTYLGLVAKETLARDPGLPSNYHWTTPWRVGFFGGLFEIGRAHV